jgi:aryl-alcohol dehydrogenase-like predicted oxidoreductase
MSSKLATRKVGTTQVSAIGYGAMGISSFYGAAAPDEERFKVTSTLRYVGCRIPLTLRSYFSQMLDAVYEAGCTNWDTADAYGDSEELIGKW